MSKLSKLLLFFLVFNISLYAQNQIVSKLKRINQLSNDGINDPSLEKWGREAVNRINEEFNSPEINSKKIDNGYYKIDDEIFIYLDYEELTKNRLRYILYTDNIAKNYLIIKDGKRCYIAKDDKDNKNYFQFKLSSIFFDDDDFNNSGYKLDKIFEKINSDFITESIIKKSDITQIYSPYETLWKNYLFEIDDRTLLFKHGIEYDIKNEVIILNPFAGNLSIPAKILPVWEKNRAIFKSTFGSVSYLNELLSIPNLFNVIESRRKIKILSSENLSISENLQKMADENKLWLFTNLNSYEKLNIINLATNTRLPINNKTKGFFNSDEGKIIRTNRMLLQEAYPGLCPLYLELPEFNEMVTGDFTNDTDDMTKALLVERNIEGRIYYEKIKNSESSDTNETIILKESQKKYAEWKESAKKSLNNSELLILSLSVKDFENYNHQKYSLLRDQSRFDENYYNLPFRESVPYEYVFHSLQKYFEKKESSKVFDELDKKTQYLLGKFLEYFTNTLQLDNKNYKDDQIRKLSVKILEKIYTAIISSKISPKSDDENWEIKIGFLKVDENTYSADFLLVEELLAE